MIYHFSYTEEHANRMPVQLLLLGINHAQDPVRRPNGLDLNQWFYCAKGEGELILRGQKYILHENECALITAHEPHEYRALSGRWRVHFIGFDGANCPGILKTLRMTESGVFHLPNKTMFPQQLRKLEYLQGRELDNKENEFSKACYAFLLDLSSCVDRIEAGVPASGHDVIQSMIRYMEDHYQTPFSLDELAAHAGLSKEYLCTLFRRNMQQTVIHYLTGLRIAHARIFLGQFPNKKVAEIARMCGFESPSYFGKLFKQEVGMTPEAYRNKR